MDRTSRSATPRYQFGTTLPAGMDVTKTHTLGIYGRRNVTQSIIGKNYYLDNVNYDFRPDGAPVTETWAAMDVAACNKCHDPLALHGGSRRTTKNCVLCHQPQSLDPTGISSTSGDDPQDPHGEDLSSVPSEPARHNGLLDVTYPQDIRNCTTCHQTERGRGAHLVHATRRARRAAPATTTSTG